MTASNDWLRATRRRVARGLRGGRRASTLAHARLALLARIGELNEMDLDTATRLDALLDAMLPDIADACAIFLIDGGQLHLTGARHVDAGREPALSDPALRGPFDLRSSHPTARAVRSHQPVLDTPSADRQGALLRSLRIGSLLTVPLVRREEPVGALLLAFDATRAPLAPNDITFAVELARRVTASLTIARRHEREREIAETLQESLLPHELPRVTGLDLAGRYRGATRGIYVGGDWYDVVPLGAGRVALAIGDVVGHGLSAANAMGRLRAGLHLCMIDGLGPAAALERLNRYSFSFEDSDMATVQVGVIDANTRSFCFASAGHPPPMVTVANDAWPIEGGLGAPLLTDEHSRYEEVEVVLPRDATVVLYTDGLIERRGESLTVGLDRLLSELTASNTTVDDTLDTLLEHLVPDGGEDDVALVAVQLTPTTLVVERDAVPSELLALRQSLRDWLHAVGATPRVVDDVVVATNEAAANAVKHAHRDTVGRLVIEGRVEGPDVVIVVTDTGHWRSSRSSEEGGRGMLMMRELMDDVTVSPGTPDLPGTTVRMRRRLSATPSG